MKTKPWATLNITTKFLVNLVFSKASLPMLMESGFVNAYLDDYGYKCKYQNCLFFLFNTDNRYYNALEKKIICFESFLDWYDIPETSLRMIVFKIGPVYQKDVENLKHMETSRFSEEFKKATRLEEGIRIELDYNKEIYRYQL